MHKDVCVTIGTIVLIDLIPMLILLILNRYLAQVTLRFMLHIIEP